MRKTILRSKLLLLMFALAGLVGWGTLQAQPAQAAHAGDVVVQTIPGKPLSGKLAERAKSSWPWYLTRASGLIAAVSLVVLLLSGIGQISGQTFRLLDPLTAWASHRALGLTFGVAVIVHVGSLLFDHFVQFDFLQILVPWASDYRPVTLFGLHLGSLYVVLGVLSFYLVGIIIISSLLWVEKKPQTWKLIHLLSYVVIAMVFVHALFIGTDLTHGWLRWAWILLNLTVLGAALLRLWRARTI